MPGELPNTQIQDASLAELEFKEMLELVDEKYRIVLLLYYAEGFKISEIAEMLDLNQNTVKTRLSRARGQIREAYLGKNFKRTQMSGNIDFVNKQGGKSHEKTEQFSEPGKYTAG